MLKLIYNSTFHTINDSLVPRLPRSMGERRSGTVASNSWSKRQTSFPLKKDIYCNERHFLSGKDV